VKNLPTLAIAAVVLFTAAWACNMSTANISSFKTSKDREGKQESTSFKGGETIYGRAAISNNMGKVKIKLKITVDDVKGMDKGDMVKGSDVTIDMDGDGTGIYSLAVPVGVKSGKYILTADMVNEAGETKDTKSVNLNVSEE